MNDSFTQDGLLVAKVDQIFAENNSTAIGDYSQNTADIHADVGSIYLSGSLVVGIGQLRATTSMVLRIGKIVRVGSPSLKIGISQSGGRIDAIIQVIDVDLAWSIGAGTLSLFYNRVSGTQTGGGTILTSTPV
jgi:hypothetical protein